MFRTARGGPVGDTGYGQVWRRARTAALTPAQQSSPLARRPYDLRHAAVSLWLNAGVPATSLVPEMKEPRRACLITVLALVPLSSHAAAKPDRLAPRYKARPRLPARHQATCGADRYR